MDGFRHVLLLFVAYLSVAPTDGLARGREVPERTAGLAGVSMRLGALRITSKVIELRCEVCNDSKQDIWLHHSGTQFRGGPNDAALYLDTDDETLVVLRRANAPHDGLPQANPYAVTYGRLPAGQSRVEILLLRLPVKVQNTLGYGRFVTLETREWLFGRAVSPAERAGMVATRLAFEIGFYTAEFLSRAPGSDLSPMEDLGVAFRESGERVLVNEFPFGRLRDHERAVRMTIEGAAIPYGDWLDFKPDESRMRPPLGVDIKPPGGLFRTHEPQPEPEPTKGEVMEHLFYDFSLGLEDYRYAKRLFSIDEALFDDTARSIADVYLQLAHGKIDPEDLPRCLDKVGARTHRERVLEKLEARTAAPDQKK